MNERYFIWKRILKILFNILRRMKKITPTLEGYNIEYSKFLEKVNKMNDYISLEIRRIEFNQEHKKKQEDNFIKQINDAIDEATQRAEESIKKTESTLNTSVISVLGNICSIYSMLFRRIEYISSINV